jgi:hypothetical protein
MFITAGARISYLSSREMDIQYQQMALSQAQYRINDAISKVYNVGDLNPNNPNVIAGHDRLVQQLFQWQKRIDTLQTRLNLEYQMIQAEKPKHDEFFKSDVKKYFDMWA